MAMVPAYPSSPREWEPHQSLITRLYRDDKKTLKEVQHILRTNHNFKATERMWKRKITEWGLDKKLKRHEVLEIVRLLEQRDREGKKSTFVIRGQVVDLDNIRRYLKRNPLSAEERVGLQPGRNAGRPGLEDRLVELECRTPSPILSAADPGGILDATETCYGRFNEYLVNSVGSGVWVATANSVFLTNKLSVEEEWVDFCTLVNAGTARFHDGRYQEGMWHVRIAFANLDRLIFSRNYSQLLDLISGVVALAKADVNVARELLRHLGNLVARCLRSSTGIPQKTVLESLSALDPTQFTELRLFSRKCTVSVFQSNFSNHQDLVLYHQAALAQWESLEGVWTFSPGLLAQVTARLGSSEEHSAVLLDAAERLSLALEWSKHYEEAERLCMRRVEHFQRVEQSVGVLRGLLQAWYDQGEIRRRLEKLPEARQSFLSAVDVFEELSTLTSNVEYEQLSMRNLLLRLEDLEWEMGEVADAEAREARRLQMMSEQDQRILQRMADLKLDEVLE